MVDRCALLKNEVTSRLLIPTFCCPLTLTHDQTSACTEMYTKLFPVELSHTTPSRACLNCTSDPRRAKPSSRRLLATWVPNNDVIPTLSLAILMNVLPGLRANRRDPFSTITTPSSKRCSGRKCSVDEGRSDRSGQKSYHWRAERGAGCVLRVPRAVVGGRWHTGKWPWVQHYHQSQL